MKRSGTQERSALASVTTTSLVVVLALVVLWQAGHSFVPARNTDIDASGETSTTQMYVTMTDVNLRSGPGTSHDILSVVAANTRIAVTGMQQSGFAPVQVEGRRAWMSTDFIAPEGSSLATTVETSDDQEPPEPAVVPTAAPTQAPEPTVRGAEFDAPAESRVEVEVPADPIVSDAIDAAESDDVAVSNGERWIEIDRASATVTLHDGEQIVAVYDALMGKDPSPDGFYSTAVGTYSVFSMNRELTETPFAPGVYLTDWVGFDPERSNGIHSPVRDATGDVVVTGGTTTLGCVRLGADEARSVFDFAFLGMRVEVHD